MSTKKPKIQTTKERERDLAIKRDKMKLLREQRKLQSNNEELTFEEDQEPPIQRERMRLLHSRRQLNCEATPSSNVGVISSATPSSNVGVISSTTPSSNVEVILSSHVEETLIFRFDDIHTP